MAMRVLIVNTSERAGGAAVAAGRLMDALNNNGVKAKMLVRDKETDDITVVGLNGGLRQRLHFLWERWCIFVHLHFKRAPTSRSCRSSRKQTLFILPGSTKASCP